MCIEGKQHSLIEIYRDSEGYGAEAVVRWCGECGAIVIDTDVDNRTMPGDVMKMKQPNIFIKAR
jgi:valyl-tRNA synthetase